MKEEVVDRTSKKEATELLAHFISERTCRFIGSYVLGLMPEFSRQECN